MVIHDVFAYLRVQNANAAIEFYRTAFGAREKFRLVEPRGRIGHAELDLGGTTVMLSEQSPEHGMASPKPIGTVAISLHLHVEDCDATIRTAVEAGAALVSDPKDHFYGERSGTVRDPFGHEWIIGHSIEHVTPGEMQRRYDALMAAAPANVGT